MIRTTLAFASVLSISISGGCVAIAAAGAGVGTYAYVSGDLEKNIEAPIDRVYEAALAVMDEMQYAVKSRRKDGAEALIRAEQADETSVKISLESKGENLTHTSIRIGMFGDEAQSSLVLEKIESRL